MEADSSGGRGHFAGLCEDSDNACNRGAFLRIYRQYMQRDFPECFVRWFTISNTIVHRNAGEF